MHSKRDARNAADVADRCRELKARLSIAAQKDLKKSGNGEEEYDAMSYGSF